MSSVQLSATETAQGRASPPDLVDPGGNALRPRVRRACAGAALAAGRRALSRVVARRSRALAWRGVRRRVLRNGLRRPRKLEDTGRVDATELRERLAKGDRSFVGVDLQGADLGGIRLVGADFSGANLSSAQFPEAYLPHAN